MWIDLFYLGEATIYRYPRQPGEDRNNAEPGHALHSASSKSSKLLYKLELSKS
jgi:hypothetical protein